MKWDGLPAVAIHAHHASGRQVAVAIQEVDRERFGTNAQSANVLDCFPSLALTTSKT